MLSYKIKKKRKNQRKVLLLILVSMEMKLKIKKEINKIKSLANIEEISNWIYLRAN